MATVLQADFLTTSVKVGVGIEFSQLKLMTRDELVIVILWTSAGMLTALISVVLALPAACQVLPFLRPASGMPRREGCKEGDPL